MIKRLPLFQTSRANSFQSAHTLLGTGQARGIHSAGISRADAIFQELKMKPEFKTILHLDQRLNNIPCMKIENQAGCGVCLPNQFDATRA